MANTGGPAFPRPMGWNGHDHHEEHESNEAQAGMSLRDYFAAKAMQGMLQAAWTPIAKSDQPSRATVTAWAYEWADAMLEQRKK